MTYAPEDLVTIAQYLVDATPLTWADLGIVAGPADAAGGGYHCGNDGLSAIGKLSSDYSKRESSRDRPGTNAASALDIGAWTGVAGRRRVTWVQFNAELVDACRRGDPRTRDVREVIYTPDRSTVRRWDALGIRTTGDSSHLYHTHLSFFRDSEHPGRHILTNIAGVILDIIDGSTDVAFIDDPNAKKVAYRLDALGAGAPILRDGSGEPMWAVATLQRIDAAVSALGTASAAEAARDAALRTVVDALVAAAPVGELSAAALMAQINDAVHAAVTPLEDTIGELRHALAQAQRAAATTLDGA
jgi:hypothetical protein